MNLTRSRAATGLLFWLLAAGCGGGGPALHPVRGKVLVGDAPAAGATVVFKPVAARADLNNPTGTVAADGTFALDTYPHGAGAPAGEYVVLVTWLPPDAREQENPKNKLPGRYADPDKTPLPRVTVREGRNDLEPFVLAAK